MLICLSLGNTELTLCENNLFVVSLTDINKALPREGAIKLTEVQSFH